MNEDKRVMRTADEAMHETFERLATLDAVSDEHAQLRASGEGMPEPRALDSEDR